MNVYRIISNTVLFQFGEPIGSVPILHVSLRKIQEGIVQSFGLKIVDISSEDNILDKEYLAFSEDLFFTKLFFELAIQATKRANSSLQFALKDNEFNQRFILPFVNDEQEGLIFNFKYIQGEASLQTHFLAQQLYEYVAMLPDQVVKGRRYPMHQCDCFAAHIISPFHLLQVNMAMNLNRAIDIQKGGLSRRFKKLKGRLGSYLFYKGLKRLNKIGKNCFIHPTAIIEGSVIGNNVRIGAYSIVRMSYVGEDCTISDNVVVANSVLGRRTYISNSNFIDLCLTYEEVFLIHGPYQFSIFGKNSACFAVINCDFRLDQQNIKIPTTIGVLDSKQPLLGIAYGHRSKTGGGNIIAAGRIVPNDRHLYPPDSIHLKFDQ